MFADGEVTSQNIVGYVNNEIETDGQQLKASSFVTIGAQDAEGNPGVFLSDLKISGYDGSVGGEFYIDLIDTDGSNVYDEDAEMNVSYFWYDSMFQKAGWYDIEVQPLKDDESPLGNADEIFFPVGTGLSITLDDGDMIGAYLTSNGQVVQEETRFYFVTDGQQLAGNPLARNVKLSEIIVDGYDGSVGGEIYIDKIDTDGSNVYDEDAEMNVSYFWYDSMFQKAGWYDIEVQPLKDDESPLGNADEIDILIGEGISVTVDDLAFTEGAYLKFPSLNNK